MSCENLDCRLFKEKFCGDNGFVGIFVFLSFFLWLEIDVVEVCGIFF